jgi:hypothetical protein
VLDPDLIHARRCTGEVQRLGVPRQSIIKVWVAERLEKMKAS